MMQIQATNKPGLYEKLETKRLAYPRFYFVSSADLLDILSNENVPERGLLNIEINSEMFSMEINEIVPFYEPCDCSEKVEIWLNRLTDKMRETLHILFRNSVVAYEEKSREVIGQHRLHCVRLIFGGQLKLILHSQS